MSPRPRPLLTLIFLLSSSLLLINAAPALVESEAIAGSAPGNQTVLCLLVFGDSTVDPGNNNHINTVFKSNFPPYGRDFKDHEATGRFTNGRLATDFIASYAGVKDFVPPYLDPSLSNNDLITGVSFASAASGYDPLTATISNVIDLPTQVEYFREYKRRITPLVGDIGIQTFMQKKTVFLISAGTNDFVVSYFSFPTRRKAFSIAAYQQFLLQHVKQLLQNLWDEGARVIAVTGLPPMGCLPAVITVFGNGATNRRECVEAYSTVARQFNTILRAELTSMQAKVGHLGALIYYIDIYTPFSDIIQGQSDQFTERTRGCCGSGYLEATFLCNPKSYVCSNPSTYVFFDSIHPTEEAYYHLFQAYRPTIDSILRL